MEEGGRLDRAFYLRDVLEVAPDLIGKVLVVLQEGEVPIRQVITETEAYRGQDDRACHASKGLTPRTRIMFGEGGFVYMYLVYGMHWMFNVVSSVKDKPQAVLVRATAQADGPGRLTRLLNLDKGYYGEDLVNSGRIWIEDEGIEPEYSCSPRIGIDYAGEPWKSLPWRYLMSLKP